LVFRGSAVEASTIADVKNELRATPEPGRNLLQLSYVRPVVALEKKKAGVGQ
jgi:hypothetical protein